MPTAKSLDSVVMDTSPQRTVCNTPARTRVGSISFRRNKSHFVNVTLKRPPASVVASHTANVLPAVLYTAYPFHVSA